jgi:hypothetical protein
MEAPTGSPKQLGLDPVGVEQEPRRCLIAQFDNDLAQDRPRPGLATKIVSSLGISQRAMNALRRSDRALTRRCLALVKSPITRPRRSTARCSGSRALTTSATAPPPRPASHSCRARHAKRPNPGDLDHLRAVETNQVCRADSTVIASAVTSATWFSPTNRPTPHSSRRPYVRDITKRFVLPPAAFDRLGAQSRSRTGPHPIVPRWRRSALRTVPVPDRAI